MIRIAAATRGRRLPGRPDQLFEKGTPRLESGTNRGIIVGAPPDGQIDVAWTGRQSPHGQLVDIARAVDVPEAKESRPAAREQLLGRTA
jgi:hypothetical protein